MGSFHCARVCTALLPLPAHARLLRLGRPASLLLLLLLLRPLGHQIGLAQIGSDHIGWLSWLAWSISSCKGYSLSRARAHCREPGAGEGWLGWLAWLVWLRAAWLRSAWLRSVLQYHTYMQYHARA